jgi:RNA ligase
MDKNLQKLINEMIEQGYISVTKHPVFGLWILNYTQKTQFERVWNEATLMCRGLIVEAYTNKIVARPFRKFFNIEELDPADIPDLDFTVTDKMDGSLGILYWFDDIPYIATRGSFTSEQALHATKILSDKYWHLFHKLDRKVTYLFEIVYPSNRIVIDYGETDDIFLIGMINTANGQEYRLRDTIKNPGFKITTVYDGVADFNRLRDIAVDNKEGFVIRFSNGLRVKMKFAEYVRLHRVLTNVTSYTVYEYLSEGKSLDTLLDGVPDEFYAWLKKTADELLEKYADIEDECLALVACVQPEWSRREIAEFFKKREHPGILFSMLDKKDYSRAIWSLLKPKFEKPFANIVDEG